MYMQLKGEPMKYARFIFGGLALLLLVSASSFAQSTLSGQGAPSGKCNPPYALGTIYTDTDPSTGTGQRLWSCANNSNNGWEQQGGSSTGASIQGTPTAADMAGWFNATHIEDAGFSIANVVRKDAANTMGAFLTDFSSGTIIPPTCVAGVSTALNQGARIPVLACMSGTRLPQPIN